MELSYRIGDLGHLMLLMSFVSLGLSFCGFVLHLKSGVQRWWRYASWMAAIHAVAVLCASGLLVYLLVLDRFEYHYVWSHSMSALPMAYKVAALWEGQEGSFLLWMIGHLCCGMVCWRWGGRWRAEVLAVLALLQLGLASMLLGVVIGGWKLGSSPFLLLRLVVEMPVFETDPGFIPEDGMGLSPLLQNYWMVIHPPVLFMALRWFLCLLLMFLRGFGEESLGLCCRLCSLGYLLLLLCWVWELFWVLFGLMRP